MASDVEVLLLESGGWLVGAEAQLISDVRHQDDRDGAFTDVSVLLGGARSSPPDVRRRCITVSDEGGAATVLVVDRTLGTESFATADLSPVPDLLRLCGAPAWWLGVAWSESRLVLLLDLSVAARVEAT